MRGKLFDKKGGAGIAGKENNEPNLTGFASHSKIIASNEVVFSKLSGESDMHLMISKSQEDSYKRISTENHELKDCLKMLQREMFDIVKLKSDIYTKRFKAENYKADDPLN